MDSSWKTHTLSRGHLLHRGQLSPTLLRQTEDDFEQWWAMHPEDFPEIMMHGRVVKTPRWQQAYGKDYRFSGQVNQALALTPALEDILSWSRQHIDAQLNGALLNWYDGQLGHYIGAHRDSTKGLIEDTPIVTISLGEARIFRMRPYGGQGFEDFDMAHGDVIVVPWQTNAHHTHEVPKFKRHKGRRISITLRAFT